MVELRKAGGDTLEFQKVWIDTLAHLRDHSTYANSNAYLRVRLFYIQVRIVFPSILC